MADVFISYKSDEYEHANRIRSALQYNRISCWMAPESIGIGSDYASEIPNAISECRVFVLLLSPGAQESEWVPKELDKAISCKRIIMPFMIEKCELNNRFGFCLSNIQMIDGYTRNRDAAVQELVERIRFVLNPNPRVQPKPPVQPPKPPVPTPVPPVQPPKPPVPTPVPPKQQPKPPIQHPKPPVQPPRGTVQPPKPTPPKPPAPPVDDYTFSKPYKGSPLEVVLTGATLQFISLILVGTSPESWMAGLAGFVLLQMIIAIGSIIAIVVDFKNYNKISKGNAYTLLEIRKKNLKNNSKSIKKLMYGCFAIVVFFWLVGFVITG